MITFFSVPDCLFLQVVTEEKDTSIKESDAAPYRADTYSTWVSIRDVLAKIPSRRLTLSDVLVYVDPLDATQEYTEGLTEYVTVMTCVVFKGEPIFGAIYRPFSNETVVGVKGWGVMTSSEEKLTPVDLKDTVKKIVVSRSHAGAVEKLAKLSFGDDYVVEPAGGSGYKTLRLLNGTAELYIHRTAIKKWDTCAGDAILRAFGGAMLDLEGSLLRINLQRHLPHENSMLPCSIHGVSSPFLFLHLERGVEWNRVRTLFQSEDVEELKECLAILSMWRSRMGNSIPVALSCSEMLVRLAISELQIANEADQWMKMEELKMQHCIVIIRFINYVNEIGQRQRQTSIVRAVQQLGIPSWLVEIRHNASHSHVPPIGTLRMGSEFCREWIWNNFWTRQPYEAMRSAGAVDTNSDVVAEEASIRDQKIRHAIIAFALWRNKAGEPEGGRESWSLYNASSQKPGKRMTEALANCWKASDPKLDFLRIFVGDGLLTMTEKQLEVARYSVSEGNGVRKENGTFNEGWVIPFALQVYWKPLFVMVYEGKVVSELIINLLVRLASADNPPFVEHQLVSWTKFFLEPCVEFNTKLHSLTTFLVLEDCSISEGQANHPKRIAAVFKTIHCLPSWQQDARTR
ncbi:hypothetical protein GCK32_003291, partial [Trichostrongylus colubriformis]